MKNESSKKVSVSCYSGYQYAEDPVCFAIDGQTHPIQEIIDRWYEGGAVSGRTVLSYFRIRTAEDSILLLRYDPVLDEWRIMR